MLDRGANYPMTTKLSRSKSKVVPKNKSSEFTLSTDDSVSDLVLHPEQPQVINNLLVASKVAPELITKDDCIHVLDEGTNVEDMCLFFIRHKSIMLDMSNEVLWKLLQLHNKELTEVSTKAISELKEKLTIVIRKKKFYKDRSIDFKDKSIDLARTISRLDDTATALCRDLDDVRFQRDKRDKKINHLKLLIIFLISIILIVIIIATAFILGQT